MLIMWWIFAYYVNSCKLVVKIKLFQPSYLCSKKQHCYLFVTTYQREKEGSKLPRCILYKCFSFRTQINCQKSDLVTAATRDVKIYFTFETERVIFSRLLFLQIRRGTAQCQYLAVQCCKPLCCKPADDYLHGAPNLSP